MDTCWSILAELHSEGASSSDIHYVKYCDHEQWAATAMAGACVGSNISFADDQRVEIRAAMAGKA